MFSRLLMLVVASTASIASVVSTQADTVVLTTDVPLSTLDQGDIATVTVSLANYGGTPIGALGVTLGFDPLDFKVSTLTGPTQGNIVPNSGGFSSVLSTGYANPLDTQSDPRQRLLVAYDTIPSVSSSPLPDPSDPDYPFYAPITTNGTFFTFTIEALRKPVTDSAIYFYKPPSATDTTALASSIVLDTIDPSTTPLPAAGLSAAVLCGMAMMRRIRRKSADAVVEGVATAA
ncbi:MAG TPA: hypothetical protein VF796_10715 [Humisphaera sp.]